MSQTVTARILAAMRSNTEYAPEALAAQLHFDLETVKWCLRELTKNGMISATPEKRYARGKKYQTRQQELRV